MLKIKDNVDLKELEKFGFIKKCNILYKPKKTDWDVVEIEITDNRELKLTGLSDLFHTREDTLYDLIHADLVEKVSD